MAEHRHLQAQAVAFAAVSLLATTACAGYDVFDKDGIKLTFNVDLVTAGFASSNSWFGQSRAFLGASTDAWSEFGGEPRLSFEAPVARGTVFAQLSGVYTATLDDDASGFTIGHDNTDEITLEQAHIGWTIDDVFSGLEDDSFTIIGGRQDYTIGTGLLIADGGSDGGNRGGWYIDMRKSFQESVIVRLKSKSLLLEAFRLENNPRAGGSDGEAYGGNVEYTFPDTATFGLTYMGVDANLSGIDVLHVVSGRVEWKPIKGLVVGGEYAHETNDQIQAAGWYARIAYGVEEWTWSPVLSYRYAHLDGDDSDTSDDERFREIAYGVTDYGTWYQGEITGNYPLGNNNLLSHLVRLELQPLETLTLNVLYYNFALDEPAGLDPGVTNDDWGDEINLAADWAVIDPVYIIGVLGVLFPGDAAEQLTGGGEDWLYSMLYLSYAY